MPHPSHESQLPGLNRARGQVDGVIRMIESGRYCVDILTQLRAVRAALRKVEQEVLQTHLHACLLDAVATGDAAEVERKVHELAIVLKRYGG